MSDEQNIIAAELVNPDGDVHQTLLRLVLTGPRDADHVIALRVAVMPTPKWHEWKETFWQIAGVATHLWGDDGFRVAAEQFLCSVICEFESRAEA